MHRVVVLVVLLSAVCFAGTSQPIALVTSSAGAIVDGTMVPNGTAVFKGDTVQPQRGNAVVTFSRVGNMVVPGDSVIRVTGVNVAEIVKGMSHVDSRGAITVVGSAWSVATEPDSKTGRSSADIFRTDEGNLSVNVKEGRAVAKRTGTKEVAVVLPGHPVLLPSAAAPDPQTAPPASTPGASRGNGKTILVGAIAAAALAASIAALATRNDNGSEINALQSQLAAQQAQIAALQSQAATLQTLATTLQAQLTALQAQTSGNAAIAAQIASLTAQLSTQLANLATVQAQLAAGTITPAEASTQIAAINATLQSLSAQIANLANQIAVTPSTP